ncbi:Atrazine chlorohydrolase [bioreactor metagenome]|uniref:Atrazine chlorohydrolase n=1 Tax=bioreactor metagenome TaxID=1076179 RepID=A0A645BZY2_9ZZZZ
MGRLQNLARTHGVRLQIHVSETEWEVRQSVADTGMTPLCYLDSIGFLSQPLILVHGVHLTPEEMLLCRRRGLTVCYNPKSNGKLGSGIAPIAELREQGVDLCLATDGAASNDLLDLFEDMRFGAMLQKLKYGDPARFGAREIFLMATEGGAKAMGLNAGRVEEGRLADLILLDLSSPSAAPVHDPLSGLVYCARAADVDSVIINGRLVMRGRRILTLDANRAVAEAVALGEKRFAEVSGSPLSSEF